MTGKPSLTIEEYLARYERYDAIRRRRHIPHPSKAGFITGLGEEAGLGLSKQSFYNYQDNFNLPFPLLPEREDALVLLLFGQPPYDITWANLAVVRVTERPLEDIIGCSSLRLLREQIPFPEGSRTALQRLKTEQLRDELTIDDVWFNVADGMRQTMRIQARYTGLISDRYYVTATSAAAPYLPRRVDDDRLNVVPNLFIEMKHMHVPVTEYRLIREQNHARALSAYRALNGHAAGRADVTGSLTVDQDDRELGALLRKLNGDPELLRSYLNEHLPPYQPPLPTPTVTIDTTGKHITLETELTDPAET